MSENEGKEQFVHVMMSFKSKGGDLQTAIRQAMSEVMGESPAAATLEYTGAAENGDIAAFVKRTEEMLESGAPIVLTVIAQRVEALAKA